jgi:hypothetical protein
METAKQFEKIHFGCVKISAGGDSPASHPTCSGRTLLLCHNLLINRRNFCPTVTAGKPVSQKAESRTKIATGSTIGVFIPPFCTHFEPLQAVSRSIYVGAGVEQSKRNLPSICNSVAIEQRWIALQRLTEGSRHGQLVRHHRLSAPRSIRLANARPTRLRAPSTRQKKSPAQTAGL